MLVKGASVYLEHEFKFADISVKDGIIDGIYEPGTAPSDEEVIDATGLYAIPGLVDLHFHGVMNNDFCDGTKEAVKVLAKFEASKGVLAICPATMTLSEERINAVIDAALEYKNDETLKSPEYAELVGIDLEGPFISKYKMGAQNGEFVVAPNAAMIERLLERSKGLIKLIAIAPETDGALECIKQFSGRTKFSVAHTVADYDTAKQAFDCGAAHVTHLYNAMPGLNHRTPGVIPAAVEAGAEAELICDGIHVHPAMVRTAFKLFGPDKVVLISDSMRACGLSDGEYDLGGQEVIVEGKKAVLKSDPNTIAGSVTNLYDCMKKAVEFGVPKEDAIRAASENPADSIGAGDRYGRIKKGAVGHFLLTDANLNLVKIV